jgi:hypothetical protein
MKSMRPIVAAALLAAALTAIGSSAANAGDVLAPIDLRQIKVGGEIGRRIGVTIDNNLLVLKADEDFLAPFRAKKGRSGYVGLGKLIDAAVRLAAYTGDARVSALKRHLVEETIKTQEPDGYIGIMEAPARISGMWDICELGYVILGLTSDHHYFGQQRSLAAARKAADYLISHWSTIPADWPRQTHVATHVSVTGLERAMLMLYQETGDERYRDFCVRERALPSWDLGIIIGRRDLVEGHVYAYVARCLAQLELFRFQPDPQLLRPSGRAVDFLTARDGMAITGGAGLWEIWTDDQDDRLALGETCATAYQIRLYESLLQLEGNSRYGDLIERTIYNALFAAQSSDGRRIRYYTPLGGKREYFPTDTYCCPCNYRRIVADLPAMVYYRSGRGVVVNLYTPSEAAIPLDRALSLKIRQTTDYPTSGRVTILVDPSRPARFPLQLRIPRWSAKPALAVNGQSWAAKPVPGTFLSLDRQWRAGDRVTLDLPMTWRLVLGRKRQAGRAAVMRGPLVFCLNPAQNKKLKKHDAADLGSLLVLDPKSLRDASGGEVVRPGGVACQAGGWFDTMAVGVPDNISFRLTEFPDPEGKLVYFRLPDLSVAVPDELLGKR